MCWHWLSWQNQQAWDWQGKLFSSSTGFSTCFPSHQRIRLQSLFFLTSKYHQFPPFCSPLTLLKHSSRASQTPVLALSHHPPATFPRPPSSFWCNPCLQMCRFQWFFILHKTTIYFPCFDISYLRYLTSLLLCLCFLSSCFHHSPSIFSAVNALWLWLLLLMFLPCEWPL